MILTGLPIVIFFKYAEAPTAGQRTSMSTFDILSASSKIPETLIIHKPSAVNSIKAQDRALAQNGNTSHQIGQFTVHHPLSALQSKIMSDMRVFYDKQNTETLLSLIKQEDSISLRSLDWLVTTFSKYNEVFPRTDSEMTVYESYKKALSKFKRRNFDPFRRSKRKVANKTVVYDISFRDGSEVVHTTIGQLNFVQWSIRTGIYDFAKENKEAIDEWTDKNYNSLNSLGVRHRPMIETNAVNLKRTKILW